MKTSPKQAAGGALLIVTQLLLTSYSSASTLRNGEYEGEMRCGAHITSPDRGPFVQPVRISVTGNTVSWSRAVDGFVEVGQGSINQDKLEMSLRGKWLKEIPQNDGWTTLVKLRYDGRSLDGTGTILSNDGRQRFRDCDVHIAILQSGKLAGGPRTESTTGLVQQQSVQSALAQQPQSGGRGQQASPSSSVDERTEEILKELSGQGASNTPSAQVGKTSVASRVSGGNQGRNDSDMRKPTEASQKSLANEVGPLFSRKSELLEMARNGRFLTDRLDLRGDYNSAFTESIRAVLANDYGVISYPTSNYSRDGVVVKRIDAGCKTELEDSVKELFGTVQAGQVAVIGDLSANPVAVPAFTREVEIAISNFNERNKSGSWCSKAGPHPYVAALPRVLQEFASSNRIAVEAARNRSRQQAEKARAEQLLREQQQAKAAIEPQSITPDMCVDSICVEQDLGALPASLAWNAPEPLLSTKQMSGTQKSAYEDWVKRTRESCVSANSPIWGSSASRLCEHLIFGYSKTSAELITFFRDNKLPVCYPGDQGFKLSLTTPLGLVRVFVEFSIDGRPKVNTVAKEFIALNDTDSASLRKLIKDKHPYERPPWGGSVDYVEGMRRGGGPSYWLKGRSSIFANTRTGPNAGQCRIADKSLGVK